MVQFFKSSYSKGMLLFTILTLCIFIYGIFRMALWLQQKPDDTNRLVFGCLAILILAILTVYAYASQIKGIEVTSEHLFIKKKIGEIAIKTDSIQYIRHKKDIMWDVRLWGISGLFGHFGWFWNQRSGNYFAIANNGNNLVEIKTANKCYVVSCDHYEELLKLLGQPQ